MKTFSALLALCAGNSPAPVNSPHKGQWRGALMFFFYLRLKKRLSKQSWRWWFETPSCSLWRHFNGMQAAFEEPLSQHSVTHCQCTQCLKVNTTSSIEQILAHNFAVEWKTTPYTCVLGANWNGIVIINNTPSHAKEALYTRFLFNLCILFIHSLQDTFTGTGAIICLLQCNTNEVVLEIMEKNGRYQNIT